MSVSGGVGHFLILEKLPARPVTRPPTVVVPVVEPNGQLAKAMSLPRPIEWSPVFGGDAVGYEEGISLRFANCSIRQFCAVDTITPSWPRYRTAKSSSRTVDQEAARGDRGRQDRRSAGRSRDPDVDKVSIIRQASPDRTPAAFPRSNALSIDRSPIRYKECNGRRVFRLKLEAQHPTSVWPRRYSNSSCKHNTVGDET